MENRLINAIFELDLIKKSIPPGEATHQLNAAIVAACDALETLTRRRPSSV